ncbi:MAG: RNA:NAD 2'-phosphotransferase [uncultured Chloroflexi bacterium]|uniref:Probable RNA 2'-phosphotransferase n=1 Tax=uncultured Chloroflexota bacterium TaxID=166587 RepID=A0A6J4IGV1_9CHLR|nr:MAG: RNA:NAD 2'-phosphotransferase [uncultured Chloroflexota bacterium]
MVTMDERRLVTVSKFLSKYLRHEPEALGLTLEPGGWVPVDALLAGAAGKGFRIGRDELDQVVAQNDKRRFSIDAAGTRIRANQGHSAAVDLQLTPVPPEEVPEVLYHGTVQRFLDAILREGLRPMQRHHVHLSPDVETASKVGMRRGRPVVLTVDARALSQAGAMFYRSANGVWLVDAVPPAYLRTLAPSP